MTVARRLLGQVCGDCGAARQVRPACGASAHGPHKLEAIVVLNGRKQAPDIFVADYMVVAHIRQTARLRILITGDAAPERIREASDRYPPCPR